MSTDRLDADTALSTRPAAADFRSVLYADGDDVSGAEEPPFFGDLNLDQVVGAIVAGRDEYELRPFFWTPLRDVGEVEYRHQVFRDLETDDVRAAVTTFAGNARRVRQYLGLERKQHHEREKQRWFLEAADLYCRTVCELRDALAQRDLQSQALVALRDYLARYTASRRFISVAASARSVLEGLSRVRYTLRIKGARITVGTYEDEADYSVEVERTFSRFRQGSVDSRLGNAPDSGSMDHVEARIAEFVARLYPAEFRALDEFCARGRNFVDQRIARFEREIQFYLAYLEHSERLAAAGLPFCCPEVSAHSKAVSAEDAFDIALAGALAGDRSRLVTNDFCLEPPERVLVVTGPNQGGKTTFARMFGQLHYLASLGLPVPARSARLFLPDRLFTHFEREERIADLRGKLDDELVRIKEILDAASGDSVVIVNEIFAATTAADALDLAANVLQRLIALGSIAVCVTFLDELASLDKATVSMAASVDPDDPSRRTFEIVRRPADGRAYALALAEKHDLTYERLRRRIGR